MFDICLKIQKVFEMRKFDYNKSYSLVERDNREKELFSFAEQELQNAEEQYDLAEIDWKELLERFVFLLRKPLISLKYKFNKWSGELLQSVKIPWFKVVVLALLTFVLMQKDMQFQFNVKSPLSLISDDRSGGRNGDDDESNLVQAISFKETGNPFAPANPETLKDKEVRAYIKKYAKVAKTEMKKYHIPASIKMAQALIESRNGKSTLAIKNNNHFGIKCFSKKCKKNHCSNFSDDHHKDFFRKYKSPWESWRAHSKILMTNRYKGLKKYGNDYKKWAVGLKKAGYATDKTYDKKLIQTIEKYQLYKLDK